VIAESTIESPLTVSRNRRALATISLGSGNTSEMACSARIGPPAAIRPTTGTNAGEGRIARSSSVTSGPS